MIRRTARLIALAAIAMQVPAPLASAQALPKPAIGPERAFAPPPRVERTLANGLRVIAVRYPTVPKVTALLTIQSGLAVDPADKAGLAQLVADAAQEGTATRSSEQIKRDVFAIGAALTGDAAPPTYTL